MIRKEISIHLQDFPDLNFIDEQEELTKNMDLVRSVCSAALSIRDSKNLRVRLPLNKLIIIGKNAKNIDEFKNIISDEVNVKTIELDTNIADKAELKLAINFKKIGAKMGSKIKEIMADIKSDKWSKTENGEIEIAGVTLKGDDFSLKLTPKESPDKNLSFVALPDNSHLIALDTNITEELKNEGLARDFVRALQQTRKDVGLSVSDRIEIKVATNDKNIINIVSSFENYIKEQILCKKISYGESLEGKTEYEFNSEILIENTKIKISINKTNKK